VKKNHGFAAAIQLLRTPAGSETLGYRFGVGGSTAIGPGLLVFWGPGNLLGQKSHRSLAQVPEKSKDSLGSLHIITVSDDKLKSLSLWDFASSVGSGQFGEPDGLLMRNGQFVAWLHAGASNVGA